MSWWLLTYLIIHATLMFGFILLGEWKQMIKERTVTDKDYVKLDQLTVIIPFRNEKHRVGGMLESIMNSTRLPVQILFIDDHSEDGTSDFIAENCQIESVQLLHLPTEYSGKKMALRYGIEASKTDWILTMDADCQFSTTYFDRLTILEKADMYCLPVRMNRGGAGVELFAIDHTLTNAINTACSGWARPILASGANLLFSRTSFNEVDSIEDHKHVASGDDVFLLKDFNSAKKDVRLVQDTSLEVETPHENSLVEFFNQRVRWIGKTKKVNDILATLLTGSFVITTLIFLVALFYLLFHSNFYELLLLIGCKLVLDMLATFHFFKRTKHLKEWLLLPVYEFILPVYTVLIGVMAFFMQPKWKGRPIIRA